MFSVEIMCIIRGLWKLKAPYAAKSLQSCLTLCDLMDCSLPGFSIHGILQERTLEWVAISSSNAWKWKVKVKSLSHVWLLVTPWTAAHQAPPSMGFSGQQYWSGVPLPSPKAPYRPKQSLVKNVFWMLVTLINNKTKGWLPHDPSSKRLEWRRKGYLGSPSSETRAKT